MLKFLSVALLVPLAFTMAACGGLTQTPIIAEATVCAEALVASGSTDPLTLAGTAAATPACIALASDALDKIIKDVTKTNTTTARINAQMHH